MSSLRSKWNSSLLKAHSLLGMLAAARSLEDEGVANTLLELDVLADVMTKIYKSKSIKDCTAKLVHIQNLYEAQQKRLVQQKIDDDVKSAHQRRIQRYQNSLEKLMTKSRAPGISAAAMESILTELDQLEVKMEAIEDFMELHQSELFFVGMDGLRFQVSVKLAEREMAANGAAHTVPCAGAAPQFGAPAEYLGAAANGAAHTVPCAGAAPQFGAPAEYLGAVAMGAAHLGVAAAGAAHTVSCAGTAPQFGAPAEYLGAVAIGAAHLEEAATGAAHTFSCADIAPQIGAAAESLEEAATGAAHTFSCADIAPQMGAPAESFEEVAIGATHTFSCAVIAPQIGAPAESFDEVATGATYMFYCADMASRIDIPGSKMMSNMMCSVSLTDSNGNVDGVTVVVGDTISQDVHGYPAADASKVFGDDKMFDDSSGDKMFDDSSGEDLDLLLGMNNTAFFPKEVYRRYNSYLYRSLFGTGFFACGIDREERWVAQYPVIGGAVVKFAPDLYADSGGVLWEWLQHILMLMILLELMVKTLPKKKTYMKKSQRN